MTTDEIELKPCPFCGADAEFESTTGGDDDCNCVCCPDCTLSMMSGPIGIGWFRTRQEAADAWNTRAPNCEVHRLREQWADAEARNVTLATVQRERDELRARVAELEAIRRLVLFETSEDADGYMPHHPREALFVLRSAANSTAPPAPAVDVDSISDEALMRGCDLIFRQAEREQSDINDMRAALRAIFNKGE